VTGGKSEMSSKEKWSGRAELKRMRSIKVMSLVPERTVTCRFEESPLLWHPVAVKKVYLIEGNGKTICAICPVHHHPMYVE